MDAGRVKTAELLFGALVLTAVICVWMFDKGDGDDVDQ